MSNVKVPGVLWVVLIVVGVGLAHRYLDDPYIVDLLFIVAGMVLKTLKLGTEEEEQAIEIIEQLKKRPVVAPVPPKPQMRGAPSEVPSQPVAESTPDISSRLPEPPNKFARWLVG